MTISAPTHPKNQGAVCHRCPLNGKHYPVSSELRPGTHILALLSHPGPTEVEYMTPACGPGGMELNRALQAVGQTRASVSLASVICCNPEDLDAIHRAQRRKNIEAGIIESRDRTLDNPNYNPTPEECCRPRLRAELAQFDHVIAFGKRAATAVIPGLTAGIQAIRGTMAQVPRSDLGLRPTFRGADKLQILPTLSPDQVLKQQRWRHVFDVDLARAFRWFRGGLQWQEPEIVYQPSPEQLAAFLWDPNVRYHAYDVETDGVQSLHARLRCIAFATPERAMVVGLLSIDGVTRFYGALESAIVDVIRRFLADENRKKVGHNAGVFDRVICEQQLGVTPCNVTDSLPIHKSVSSEMPHNLGFVGSFYTDVHAWKADKTATTAETDMSLWYYCAMDVVVNARVMAPMIQCVIETRQAVGPVGRNDVELLANRNRSPVDRDHAMQVVAVGMKRQGMLIDQAERARWDARLREELNRWQHRIMELLPTSPANMAQNRPAEFADATVDERERALDAANNCEDGDGDSEGYVTRDEALALGLDVSAFNPGSTQHVGTLLYGVWGLPEANDLKPKDLYTGSGTRSTGSAVLQAYMVDRRLHPEQRALCHAILMWRKQKKLLGTYVVPARLPDGGKARCFVHGDGRIHADWNILPLVGRFNSSGPNVQNWPSRYANANMKSMIIPAPGHVFVGADVDQFHLRLIANRWRVQALLDCFANDWDPHAVAAETFMGDLYRNAPGYAGWGVKPAGKTLAAQLRDVAKRLRYAGAYGATPETIFRVLRSAVDENGKLVNPNLTLTMVYLMHENWMAAEPEWQRAWDSAMARWTALGGPNGGYLESPTLGRRRYCLDGNPNDLYNYEILSDEGDIMGDMTCEFVERVPFGYAGPGTGLINQCHDSMTAEVPNEDAARVSQIMLECMNRPTEPVPITSGVDVGDRWSEV